jgi:hypothetical protein
MSRNDERRPGKRAASNVKDVDKSSLLCAGCACGHFYDEDCIRHLPVEGTGARYKSAQKKRAA